MKTTYFSTKSSAQPAPTQEQGLIAKLQAMLVEDSATESDAPAFKSKDFNFGWLRDNNFALYSPSSIASSRLYENNHFKFFFHDIVILSLF